MNTATWLSLHDELEKIASHAAELAGLGILAAPSIQHLRGKEMSEKNKARTEVAGLGVLAAPSALAAGKAGLSKGKALLRARRVAGFASKVAAVDVSKLAGVPKGLKDLAESAYDAYDPKLLSKAQKYAKTRSAANGYGKSLGLKARDGSLMGREHNKKLTKDGITLAKKEVKDASYTSPAMSGPSPRTKAGKALQGGIENRQDSRRIVRDLSKDISKKKQAAVSSSQMKKMYQLSSRASGPIAQAVESTAKLRSSPSNLSRAVHIAGQTASGGHAWNPATAAKRAISL